MEIYLAEKALGGGGMIVVCEKCQQENDIVGDEIKAGTNFFRCRKCGEYIIVTQANSDTTDKVGQMDTKDELQSDDSMMGNTDRQNGHGAGEPGDTQTPSRNKTAAPGNKLNRRQSDSLNRQKPGTGVTIRMYLSMTFLSGFLFMSAVIFVLYWLFVPKLVNEQIDQRTAAISEVFSGSVKHLLMVNNYLNVNQETERISQLPGVAYASVLNKNGIVIAGVFSQPSSFQLTTLEAAKNSGFPKELAMKNILEAGETTKSLEFVFSGQPVYDVAISLGEVGGEVHVGLFLSDIQKAVRKSFVPLLISIAVLFIMGMIAFSLLAKFISDPVQELTELANRISRGEIHKRIEEKGPREIRELGRSLERLRLSVRAAIKRWQG